MKEIAIKLFVLLNFVLLVFGVATDETESVVIGCCGLLSATLWRLEAAVEAKRVLNVSINTTPKWIALSERQPEEEKDVALWGFGGWMAIAQRTKDGWEVNEGVEATHGVVGIPVRLDFHPTHWMPLPGMPEVAE